MMNYKIKSKDLTEVLDEIKEIDNLLTERIVDLNNENVRISVIGGAQARHAYIYYRSLLWKVRDKLIKSAKEI